MSFVNVEIMSLTAFFHGWSGTVGSFCYVPSALYPAVSFCSNSSIFPLHCGLQPACASSPIPLLIYGQNLKVRQGGWSVPRMATSGTNKQARKQTSSCFLKENSGAADLTLGPWPSACTGAEHQALGMKVSIFKSEATVLCKETEDWAVCVWREFKYLRVLFMHEGRWQQQAVRNCVDMVAKKRAKLENMLRLHQSL